jgi:transposase
MEVVYARCCGLDIHKRSVVACVIVPDAAGKPKRTIRRYSTMTDDLLRLGDRLASEGVTHVALESTGVYWKPVYNLLEGRFALLLVNAQHLKAVPGRKTDVCDAAWLAELLRHGLLEGSFVPDRAQRELRELTRYRTSLIRERAREANRVQATLEGANIKLAAVASDVLGASGRAMLAALIAGATAADAPAVADLAQRRLRAKLPALERALAGRMGAHQRFLLARQLAHIDVLDAQIARLDAEVAARLRPFEAELARLDGIPGIGRRTAEVVLAEIGTDLRRFPTAQHLASWAGMAPGNKQSAGKRLSGRTRKGNRWLRAALVEAAHGAARTKGTYLAAQYRRLAARRGAKRAAVAVGHSLLVIAYHLLREQTTYRDLGSTYFDARDREAVARRAVGRLQALGFTVTIQRAAPPAPAHPQGSADVPEVPVAV